MLCEPLNLAPAAQVSPSLPAAQLTLALDVRRPTAHARPDRALGWSLDGGDAGESAPLFDPRNRARLRALARGPVSYRLRTELAGEVWHWSAYGRWSDGARRQGYWVGDARREDRASVSYGFRLPRRGDSRDEANDDGYSRLDDGDATTFWKSNPYLARPFIGAGLERPEWIKADLGTERPVDGLEVVWRDPFARHLKVQFWRGQNPWSGRWVTFPSGDVVVSRSGVLRLHLAPAPLPVQFVRLLMEKSSRTGPPGATDPRDSAGYAIAELRLGVWRGAELADVIAHAPDGRRQSRMIVSSTDPWHREQDRDTKVEQPSPLRLMRLGLLSPTRMTLPLGVLYDTPQDALAELSYFRRFGLRPREIELGEEPEGQQTDPEVFARLYAQLAARLASVRSGAKLIGPSLINVLAGTRLDDDPEHSWTRRMLAALRVQAPSGSLAAFSLEHYPDDDLCISGAERLGREPGVMKALFRRLQADGLPPHTPVSLTEVGQSAYTGQADVNLESGLFAAEALAEFFSRGGAAAYLYGLTPAALSPAAKACAGTGEMSPYLLDATGFARWLTPSLVAARMIGGIWLSAHGDNELFAPAESARPGSALAYAARRSDKRWAVMLVNPSASAQSVRLNFTAGGPKPSQVAEFWRFGPDQYRWSSSLGRPLRDERPARGRDGRWGATVLLPPQSITVARDR